VGVGINTSVFTVFNAFALRPHVYNTPETFLRVIPKSRFQDESRRASYGEYIAFRDRSQSLRQLAAWSPFPAFIGGDSAPVSTGFAVSCNFFLVDGADRPVLGRLFTPDDCRFTGGASAALISESYWRTRFASDPAAVGRILDLNNRPVRIVGVVSSRAGNWVQTGGWSRRPDVWLPFTAASYFEPSGDAFAQSHFWLFLAGRLAPWFSRADAEAELNVVARQQDRLNPGRNSAITTTDGSWIEELEVTLTGRDLMLMGFFLGAFNLVLFISCANVATLLLARAASRRREIAVRLSLGASRVRLVRMLVTESLLLASVSGAASIFLAWHVPRPLFRFVAGRVPDFPMTPDWRMFAYVAGVVIVTGVLAGLAPALESVKVDITGSLKGAGALRSAGGRRLEGLLVSAQVAMSMALLVGGALFAQAENRTLRADPGYLADKLVMAPLFFPDSTSLQTAAAKLAQIAQRVKALPGARSVAFSEGLPLFDRATVELRPPLRPDASQPVDIFTASPDFFVTVGVPLLRGRELQPFETSSAVISQSLAWAFWPRQDPIGKVLVISGARLTVVGVVKNIDPLRFGGSENPALYRPWRLHPVRNVLSARFDSGAQAGAAAIRAIIHETEPNALGMAAVAQQGIQQMTGELWNMMGFIVLLGAVATLLATTGIYGAVSFAVSRMTRELGIRMALGARKPDIIRRVIFSGGKPVMEGLVAGLWLSAAIAAALRQAFSGSPLRLDTANPLPYCGAALLLALAAALAMLSPVRRGARSDPLDALRCE
jgi:predicted permease